MSCRVQVCFVDPWQWPRPNGHFWSNVEGWGGNGVHRSAEPSRLSVDVEMVWALSQAEGWGGDGVYRSAEPSRLSVDVEMVRALSFAESSSLSDTRAESSGSWCSQASVPADC